MVAAAATAATFDAISAASATIVAINLIIDLPHLYSVPAAVVDFCHSSCPAQGQGQTHPYTISTAQTDNSANARGPRSFLLSRCSELALQTLEHLQNTGVARLSGCASSCVGDAAILDLGVTWIFSSLYVSRLDVAILEKSCLICTPHGKIEAELKRSILDGVSQNSQHSGHRV